MRELVPAVFFSWRMNYTAMNRRPEELRSRGLHRRHLERVAMEHLGVRLRSSAVARAKRRAYSSSRREAAC